MNPMNLVPTPCFLFDESAMRRKASTLRRALTAYDVSILFSQKANSCPSVLRSIASTVDGFACSSLFEMQLARQIMPTGQVAFTALNVPFDQRRLFEDACDTLTLNSLQQWRRGAGLFDRPSLGIRVDPALSIVDDLRYDPCRKHTKLGVRVNSVREAWDAGDLRQIRGIHFHTACCTTSWVPLLRSVRAIEEHLDAMMKSLRWINVGGGYQWDNSTDFGPLQEAADLLTNTYGLKMFLEPGDGIVNSAGSLIASVVDLFESDGKTVAILDTTVSHLPEIFEYQYEPDVAEHVESAPHEYILAGCSCLAGDLFGEYTFEEPLDIGSRITFDNVGAYNLVRSTMFNGINLPSIYILQEDGRLDLIREFTYEDYLARCGGEAHAVMPARI